MKTLPYIPRAGCLCLSCLLVVAVLTPSCTSSEKATDRDSEKEEWIALFDGAGLSDWTPKFTGHALGKNPNNRFRVQDSLLVLRYAPADTFKAQFGHLYYNRKFSHYRLKATYRFTGDQMTNAPEWAFRNNGLMLHCQDPATLGMDQDFPISLEMQLLGGNGTDPRPTGNLCTPGTNVVMADSLVTTHCINSTSPTYHGDQWVTVEALVLGDSLIRHIVDGQIVLEYAKPTIGGGGISGYNEEVYKPGQPLRDGYIAIQAETHPIDFMSIELLNLCGCMDEKAKNYKSYYVKADNAACIYP